MLDAAYTISRYERMVIIAIGAICANAIHVAGFSPALDPDGFDTHAFAVCWATPWAAFVIKIEYFDLSQYHGSDAGLHATRTSRLRSVLWSLCHMPLLGTIFWISTALATLLDGKNDGAPDWEFGAAFATYLGLSSLMQAMHHQDKVRASTAAARSGAGSSSGCSSPPSSAACSRCSCSCCAARPPRSPRSTSPSSPSPPPSASTAEPHRALLPRRLLRLRVLRGARRLVM